MQFFNYNFTLKCALSCLEDCVVQCSGIQQMQGS